MFSLAWVLGGAVALAGALTYAELSSMMPRTGGIYVYLREAFGPGTAFVFGWAELIALRPAAYGAISVTSAEYMWRLLGQDGLVLAWGLPLSKAQLVAAVFVVVVGAVNYRGVKAGAAVQNISTVLKMGALLALVVVGFALAPVGSSQETVGARPSSLSGFWLAMIAVLWSYDGWADVGFVAGEVRSPERSLPRAFVLGTVSVVVLYLAANAVYAHVVPLDRMPGSPLIAADVAAVVFGPTGVVLVSAAVMVSTFGTLNGSMMTGPRVFFAMAEDRLFFRSLARVDPRYGTPTAAIALSMALGVVFVSVRTFAELADQFIVGIWPFYALGVAAVFVLRRKRPDAKRPYRTWGYPAVPALFLVAAIALLVNYLLTEPVLFAVNFGLIGLGIPVYFYWRRDRKPSR